MLPGVSRRVARRTIGMLVVVTLLTVPAVVLANHQFPDVPNAHPFHDEISAIAEAGITAGFMDGGYHPSDAVTRQAMAAFMERGFGHARVDIGQMPLNPILNVGPGASSTTSIVVKSATVEVPGATNAFSPTQLVYLRGTVTFLASMSTAGSGCPCEFAATFTDVASMTTSLAQLETFESVSANAYAHSVHVEAIFAVPPGSRTFQLSVFLNSRANPMNPASFPLDYRSSLTAATFPFALESPGS